MVAANVGVWALHKHLTITALVTGCHPNVAAITTLIDIGIIQLPPELAAESPITERIRVSAWALRHYLKEKQVVAVITL